MQQGQPGSRQEFLAAADEPRFSQIGRCHFTLFGSARFQRAERGIPAAQSSLPGTRQDAGCPTRRMRALPKNPRANGWQAGQVPCLFVRANKSRHTIARIVQQHLLLITPAANSSPVFRLN